MKNWLKSLLVFTGIAGMALPGFSQGKDGAWEFVALGGITCFDSDLGGKGPNKTDYLGTAQYSFGIGARYILNNYISFRPTFIYGNYYADDALSDDVGRRQRNLNVKSYVADLSINVEFSLVNWQQTYSRSGRTFTNGTNIYAFSGFGMFFFNPTGEIGGSWYELQPLGTEGQGVAGSGRGKYALNSFGIPVGIGIRQKLTNGFSLGMEFNYRRTFTDYMDDVSTTYYNNAAIAAANGELAAALADKTLDGSIRPSGSGRGNPKVNDAFFFVQLTLSKRIGEKGSGAGFGGRRGGFRSNNSCPSFR